MVIAGKLRQACTKSLAGQCSVQLQVDLPVVAHMYATITLPSLQIEVQYAYEMHFSTFKSAYQGCHFWTDYYSYGLVVWWY